MTATLFEYMLAMHYYTCKWTCNSCPHLEETSTDVISYSQKQCPFEKWQTSSTSYHYFLFSLHWVLQPQVYLSHFEHSQSWIWVNYSTKGTPLACEKTWLVSCLFQVWLQTTGVRNAVTWVSAEPLYKYLGRSTETHTNIF